MPNNILILGAGGVFGNHNAKFLLENTRDNIIAVGRNPRLGPEFTLNVGVENNQYEYHQIHMVFELEKLKKLIKSRKINIIINYAALAYANSWDEPQHYFRTNSLFVAELVDFLGTIDFFDYFVQIGTSEVYGSTEEPAVETLIAPTSPYSVSKLGADMFLQSMSSVRGFPTSIIRPSNCFGEGQYVYRILPKVILYLLQGKEFPLEGGGTAEKSFMHIDNVSNAVNLILTQRPAGEIYNCGPNAPISMKALVERVCFLMGASFEKSVTITPGREFEDQRYWLNSEKLKRDLGWDMTVDMDQGLERMITWVKRYQKELGGATTSFELRA